MMHKDYLIKISPPCGSAMDEIRGIKNHNLRFVDSHAGMLYYNVTLLEEDMLLLVLRHKISILKIFNATIPNNNV